MTEQSPVVGTDDPDLCCSEHELDLESLEFFRSSGLLMLVNMAVLWPRGYALRIVYEGDGEPVGMDLKDFGEYMAGFGPGSQERDLAEQIMNQLINHELGREAQFTRTEDN